jgi:Recombination directionality factor-like
MGSRIRTLQMQARELGRLRTGTFEKPAGGRGRPTRSPNWILTSASSDYIEAAAAEWGGKAEKWQPQGNGAQQFRVITTAPVIDAILAPGDPLSQSLELWNRGGCARRCDGYTETLSNQPCVCVEEYGPEFFKVAAKDEVCKMTTRLNVILPSLPDIGVWRVETGSYWAANEIAAAVDVLKSATGPDALIPVRLRIEQRTRVAGGKTKHYPVIAVELRGATAGQVLEAVTGSARIAAAPGRVAIEAAKPDYVAQAKAANGPKEFEAVANAAASAGHMDEALRTQLADVWKAKTATAAPIASADPSANGEAEIVDGEPEDSDEIDREYAAVIDNCPEGRDMSWLNAEFARRNGNRPLNTGTVAELRAFKEWLITDGAK